MMSHMILTSLTRTTTLRSSGHLSALPLVIILAIGTLAFIPAHVNFLKYPLMNHLVVINHLVGLLASIRRLVASILTTIPQNSGSQ
jgi:hypothetical protein